MLLVYVNTFWIVYVWLTEYYSRKKKMDAARRLAMKEREMNRVDSLPIPNKKMTY